MNYQNVVKVFRRRAKEFWLKKRNELAQHPDNWKELSGQADTAHLMLQYLEEVEEEERLAYDQAMEDKYLDLGKLV